jgi:hypothetical protein
MASFSQFVGRVFQFIKNPRASIYRGMSPNQRRFFDIASQFIKPTPVRSGVLGVINEVLQPRTFRVQRDLYGNPLRDYSLAEYALSALNEIIKPRTFRIEDAVTLAPKSREEIARMIRVGLESGLTPSEIVSQLGYLGGMTRADAVKAVSFFVTEFAADRISAQTAGDLFSRELYNFAEQSRDIKYAFRPQGNFGVFLGALNEFLRPRASLGMFMRHRDWTFGRFDFRRQTQEMGARSIARANNRMRNLAALLNTQIRNGVSIDTAISNFRNAMRANIRMVHYGAAIAGAGGLGNLSENHINTLNEEISRQFRFLERYTTQLETRLRMNRMLTQRDMSRAGMYANAARVTMQQSARQTIVNEAGPLAFEQRMLSGNGEHCSDCIQYAELGCQPVGTLPPIGESICGSNCQCEFRYMTADECDSDQDDADGTDDQTDRDTAQTTPA